MSIDIFTEQLRTKIIYVIRTDQNCINKFPTITDSIHRCYFEIRYSYNYCNIEWNTYSASMDFHVPYEFYDDYLAAEDELLTICKKMFGKHDEHYLTRLQILGDINEFEEESDDLDFSSASINQTADKLLSDIYLLIRNDKYDSAFDRTHTLLHDFLIYALDKNQISHGSQDNLSSLFSNLIKNIPFPSNEADLIRSILRSFSGTIDQINMFRNKHSLAHPTTELINPREAKFVIAVTKNIIDYLIQVI